MITCVCRRDVSLRVSVLLAIELLIVGGAVDVIVDGLHGDGADDVGPLAHVVEHEQITPCLCWWQLPCRYFFLFLS